MKTNWAQQFDWTPRGTKRGSKRKQTENLKKDMFYIRQQQGNQMSHFVWASTTCYICVEILIFTVLGELSKKWSRKKQKKKTVLLCAFVKGFVPDYVKKQNKVYCTTAHVSFKKHSQIVVNLPLPQNATCSNQSENSLTLPAGEQAGQDCLLMFIKTVTSHFYSVIQYLDLWISLSAVSAVTLWTMFFTF